MKIVEFDGLCKGTVIKYGDTIIVGIGEKIGCSSEIQDKLSYA